jgi:MFS family permease
MADGGLTVARLQNSLTMVQSPAIEKSNAQQLLQIPVIVASLGNLVDLYDLFLFSIVRVESLQSLGLSPDRILEDGILLLNLQGAGLLLGGILWGILGDKKGRRTVLFGSILIYSLANIGNGFVTSVEQYAVLRFIAGIGLAGELGAAITLVSEILPKKIRGYGTMLVATTGLGGVILAYVITDLFTWRFSYFIGGGLGLVLLFLRVRVLESGMFEKLKSKNIRRGNVLMLLNNRRRFVKYIKSILIALPIWFVIGILLTFSPEFGKALGLQESIEPGKAVMIFFATQVIANIASTLISQRLKSRRKAIFLFMMVSLIFVLIYLLVPPGSATIFYLICACLGVGDGYWPLFVTVAAELFGTNLRATVATSVPNIARGLVIPLTATFSFFKSDLGIVNAALVVGAMVYLVSFLALGTLEETFDRDLDFEEGKY